VPDSSRRRIFSGCRRGEAGSLLAARFNADADAEADADADAAGAVRRG
jgi:hypothetical protein